MSQWLCVALAHKMGSTNALSHTETAVKHMRDQLNDSYRVDETFYYYDVEEPLDTDPVNYGDSISEEKQYIRDALAELHDQGDAIDGDAYIIPDGMEKWGYGRGHVKYEPDSSTTIWGGRAIHTPSQTLVTDPKETFQNIALHNMCHNLAVWHKYGTYYTYLDSNDTKRHYDVTPIATVYTYTSDGHNDTCWESDSSAPSEFCYDTNHVEGKFCDHGTCEATCRHDMSLSSCTLDRIDETTPL